jgi:hypothetical protein
LGDFPKSRKLMALMIIGESFPVDSPRISPGLERRIVGIAAIHKDLLKGIALGLCGLQSQLK